MTTEILAPMPGTIVEIKVVPGEEVLLDQELVVLESMKMENPVRATVDGVVKEILIAKADKVRSSQVLVTLA